MRVKKLQPYIIVCMMIKNSGELIVLAQPLWRFNVYIYSQVWWREVPAMQVLKVA